MERGAEHGDGGGGGGARPPLEQRVEALESRVERIEQSLQRIEVVLAEIGAKISALPTSSDYAGLRKSLKYAAG